MIIDTQLHDDIFRLEREYETAMNETNAVIASLFFIPQRNALSKGY